MSALPPRGDMQWWLASVLYEGHAVECMERYACRGQRLIPMGYSAEFEIVTCGADISYSLRTTDLRTEQQLRDEGLFKAAGMLVEEGPDRKVYLCTLLRKADEKDLALMRPGCGA